MAMEVSVGRCLKVTLVGLDRWYDYVNDFRRYREDYVVVQLISTADLVF